MGLPAGHAGILRGPWRVTGFMITLENNAANPGAYAVNKKLKASFSSENMIWTGLLILHLHHWPHYSFHRHALRRTSLPILFPTAGFDVFTMVVDQLPASAVIAFVYVAAMIVLFLHLNHGIQSFFQTMGWNNDCTSAGHQHDRQGGRRYFPGRLQHHSAFHPCAHFDLK